MTVVAITLAALVLTMLLFVLRFVRGLMEKAEFSFGEMNILRNQIAAMSADNLKAAGAAADSIRNIELEAIRLREEAELRLAEVEVDFRDHANNLRELVRAHSEHLRAQDAQIATQISGCVEVVDKIRVRMDEIAGKIAEIAALRADVSKLSTKLLDCSDRIDTAGNAIVDLSFPVRMDEIAGKIAEIAALRADVSKLSTKLSDCSDRIDTAGNAIVDLSSGVLKIQTPSPDISPLSERVSECLKGLDAVVDTVSGVAAQVGDLRGDYATLTDTVEMMLHMPSRNFPIDQQALRRKTESEIVALAEAVAIVRPLVPYPKWQFDADWANPDLAFQLRQSIWQCFNDRRSEAPIVIDWYYGTRLALYLGNDLSRQIYIAGCIEPNEFAFLDRLLQPGMTVFDAGANEGIYSVFAASRVGAQGAVWAFEPSQRELRRLRKNLALNQFGVRVFPLALADRAGEAELTIASYEHEGQNTLGAFVYDIESSGKERAPLSRLDDLVALTPPARIDLIKVDVEGAEIGLFAGASETLHQYRPFLLFEASDDSLKNQGGSGEQLLTMIQNCGYTIYCFDLYSGLPVPLVSGKYTDNLIGVPQGKALPDSVFHPWPPPVQ